MGKTLMSRYRAALAERNQQVEAHRGLTNSLDPALVAKWESMCVAWEEEDYPKTGKNLYKAVEVCEFVAGQFALIPRAYWT